MKKVSIWDMYLQRKDYLTEKGMFFIQLIPNMFPANQFSLAQF